jgi:glycosyltransferase involved in cell wall biosynthesis
MLVSIYMPTKNRSDLLQRAAASVLAQTHPDIELLIVDDGSTDDTPAVMKAMAERDPRVRIFRNEQSKGAPFSRNIAISAARGEWITGLDDDDTFMPERIASLIDYWKLLESAGAAFSCLYTQDVYDDGVSTSVSSKRGTIEWKDMLEFNVVGNQIFCLTERVKAAGMFDVDMPAWQDLDMFIRVLKQFGPARLLDAALYRLSVDDRVDRISKSKKARIINAFDRLSTKHPEAGDVLRQKLFLQVFGKLYGHRPDVKDALRFMSFGWDFNNARRFLGLILKRG